MIYLVDNILFISILLVLVAQLSYWIADKIKIKKDIKKLEESFKKLEEKNCDMEESLKKLRATNHSILNNINNINMKLAIDENNNKTD